MHLFIIFSQAPSYITGKTVFTENDRLRNANVTRVNSNAPEEQTVPTPKKQLFSGIKPIN